MTDAEKLTILKSNLQMITSSNDELLAFLLRQGAAALANEGVTDDGSVIYEACQIDYAAYLFRKRAASTANGKASETAMPRFLRWEINNLLVSQKIREGQA